jgi:poly-gamma-glutamate synthesis protein (capsule biosynthesis protein)
MAGSETLSQRTESTGRQTRSVTLFLCGDVTTGRGIDQILPHPGEPQLFETCMRSALGYVELAERASGPISRPVDFAYIWGDALATLERLRPDVRIVNLETAVTVADDAWPGKRIHYRMHPGNLPCLTAAKIDCCVLANNHVMDWGRGGLVETLDVSTLVVSLPISRLAMPRRPWEATLVGVRQKPSDLRQVENGLFDVRLSEISR